jgi:molybdate transport system substrate-binding protein
MSPRLASVALVAGALAAACSRTPAPTGPLRVSAAVSLTEALEKAVAKWKDDGGRAVTLNFAASNVLARQILEGAPVDVFLSADEEQMNHLVAAGAVDASDRVDLLTNQLVVVTPAGRPLPGEAPAALASSAVKRVAIGDPQGVPAGVYAKAWLIRIGLWRQVEPKIVPAISVRAALAAVEAANADAGIVYRTDLREHSDVTLSYAVPVADGPRILYPAAIVKRTSDREAARALLAFLQGVAARAIFEDAGFRSARDSAAR